MLLYLYSQSMDYERILKMKNLFYWGGRTALNSLSPLYKEGDTL